ncbi:MAG: FxLYD domain-containing protein [Gemmatimonadota bacterium]|nr:FxLYD domain-containing protein [Gemmatimonadota bacterium]
MFVAHVAPAPLMAQDAASKCDEINDGSPFQLKGAGTYIVFIANPKKEDETKRHMKSAIGLLTTDADKIKNETGRQYLLLRLYNAYLGTGAPFVAKRGDLGYATNTDGTENLLMAIDTAVTYLEANVPTCKAVFRPYRDKYFGEFLNKAIAAMKANNVDSTKFYVRMAQSLSPNDPRTWNVLTAVYNTENKQDSAVYTMNKVIELSGNDPVYKAVRQQARYNIAVLTLNDADAMQGEAKTAGLVKAKALLEAYLKDSPDDTNAKQALARTLTASGDTAAIANIFADMVDHPEKFTWIQLFEAASNASNARRDADAIKLFNNGLALNPYHRDALFNLANALFALKDADRMLPTVQRLLAVDPNNGNAVRLYAGAWQVRRQAEKDKAKGNAMTDSILYWLDREKKLDPRVNVSSAVATAKNYVVRGTVENTGASTASYTMKFQFLDKDGKALASKDVTVGPVAAGASASFSATVEMPGIIAYKYAPIP